jgi:hypothetical protein
MPLLLALPQIVTLITALAPLVVGGAVGVEHVVAAIQAVRPEAEVDDDLRALIVEALAAKAEADRAAAGEDPR